MTDLFRCNNITHFGILLITERCYKCKTPFAMSETTYRAAQERKGELEFFCPNGHKQYYVQGETEEQKLRRERDNLKQQMARVEQERDEANAIAEKNQRALKRHKKRASAGTCPCCQRTFANMAAHMKQQHPTYVQEQGAKVVPLKRA